MKIIFTREGESFIYREQDLHTKHGMVRKPEIDKSKAGSVVNTNTGKEMIVSEANFMDSYRRLKRGAQIMLPKEIGAIIAETGINSRSKVLDAGSGSGALACFLAHVAKKVYSYDIREEHLKIVSRNIENLGIKNISLKHKDVYESIDEKKLDAVILDLPEPWRAVGNAAKALSHGGYLVSYSPNISQVSGLVEAVEQEKSLLYMKTVEIIEREWEIDSKRTRPKFQMLGHTGFLSFARKL